MTQLERIQLKLNESKKVNVEFGLLQDLQKESSRLISWFDKANSESKDLADEFNRISSLYSKMSKEADVAIKKAIELDADEVANKFKDMKSTFEKNSSEASAKYKKML